MADIKKYLDFIGLTHYDEKIKEYIGKYVQENGTDVTNKLIALIGAAEKGDEKTILARIADLEAAVGDVSELGADVENLTKAILGEAARAKAAEKANADAIKAVEALHATNEDGTFKKVVEEVNEAVTALVNGAPEALNTLKEIADWIAADETGTADLVSKVEKNASDIAAEKSRAEGAESTLQGNIDAVGAKVDAFAKIENSEIDALFAVSA